VPTGNCASTAADSAESQVITLVPKRSSSTTRPLSGRDVGTATSPDSAYATPADGARAVEMTEPHNVLPSSRVSAT
jgi:hypothetical protein